MILQTQGCVSIAHFNLALCFTTQHTPERTPSPADTYVAKSTQSKTNVLIQHISTELESAIANLVPQGSLRKPRPACLSCLR